MAPKLASFESREERERIQRSFLRSLKRNSDKVYVDPSKDLAFRHWQIATPTEKDRMLSLFAEDRSCKWVTESAKWMDRWLPAPAPAAAAALAPAP